MRYLQAARDAGLRRAVVSSSANCQRRPRGRRDRGPARGPRRRRRRRGAPPEGQARARHLPRGRRASWASARARRGLRGRARRRAGRARPATSATSSASTAPASARRCSRTAPRRRRRPRRAAVIAQPHFTVEPWAVPEEELDLDMLAQTESVFALSNGHIGLRANLDEGEPYGMPGTYLNAFYEVRPLPYAEAGYGYPEDGPDRRQRHQRQAHPAAGRRRAVRRALRHAARAPAHARPARRRAAPRGRLALAGRARGQGALGAAGVLRPPLDRRDPLRGRAARRRDADRPAVRARRQRGRAGAQRGPARGGGAARAAGRRVARHATSCARCSSTARAPASCGWRPGWTTWSTGPRARSTENESSTTSRA